MLQIQGWRKDPQHNYISFIKEFKKLAWIEDVNLNRHEWQRGFHIANFKKKSLSFFNFKKKSLSWIY